ncbi:MAG: glutathione S-transferase family protein [Alphaproteobacteria bacterium]
MLKLFTATGTIGLACEIALEEAGAACEVVRMNFADNAQRQPDYLAINPKSRVPALVCDQGVITEAPAILGYVAQAFPGARLAPLEDAFAMAQVQAFNSYLCSWVHPAAAHRHRGYRWADTPAALADMREKAPKVFAEAIGLIEAEYLCGPWVMGERYTICDPYLYVVSSWLPRDGIEMAQFPKVADHFARMGARAAVKTVLGRVAAG